MSVLRICSFLLKTARCQQDAIIPQSAGGCHEKDEVGNHKYRGSRRRLVRLCFGVSLGLSSDLLLSETLDHLAARLSKAPRPRRGDILDKMRSHPFVASVAAAAAALLVGTCTATADHPSGCHADNCLRAFRATQIPGRLASALHGGH